MGVDGFWQAEAWWEVPNGKRFEKIEEVCSKATHTSNKIPERMIFHSF